MIQIRISVPFLPAIAKVVADSKETVMKHSELTSWHHI
jgi:hypothetical protein